MLAMHRDGLIELPRPSGNGAGRSPSSSDPTRAAAVPRATTLGRGSPARLPRRRAQHPGGQALETSSWPATTTSDTKTLVGAQMRLRRPRPKRLAARHARLLHRGLEARPARQLHRMVAQLREKNLPLVVDNPRFLILPWIEIPNLGSHILAQCAAVYPKTGPSATASPRADRDVRRDPALHRRRLPHVGLGPASGPPRGAGATTGTSCSTSPARTSGSGLSEGIGNERSTR